MGQVPITGVHTHKYSTNDVYQGNFTDSQRSGYGVLTTQDGDVYSGDWLYDKRHGTGEMKYTTNHNNNQNKETEILPDYIPNNEHSLRFRAWQRAKNYRQQQKALLDVFFGTYNGYWLSDRRNAFGTFSYSNKDSFYGEWSNDARQGKGILVYGGSIDEYCGAFQHNFIQGWGCMKFGLFPTTQKQYQQTLQIRIEVLKHCVMKHLFTQLKLPLADQYQLSDSTIETFFQLTPSASQTLSTDILSAQSSLESGSSTPTTMSINMATMSPMLHNEYDTDMHLSSNLPAIEIDTNTISFSDVGGNNEYADGYINTTQDNNDDNGYVSSYTNSATLSHSPPTSQQGKNNINSTPSSMNKSITSIPQSTKKKKINSPTTPSKKKYNSTQYSIDLSQLLSFIRPDILIQKEQQINQLMDYAIDQEQKKQTIGMLHRSFSFITHSIEIEGFWLSNQISGPNARYFNQNSKMDKNDEFHPNLNGFCIIRKYTQIIDKNMSECYSLHQSIQEQNDIASESNQPRTKYATILATPDNCQYLCEIRIVPVSVGRKCVETYGKIDVDILELEANQEILIESGDVDDFDRFDETIHQNEPELSHLDDFLASPTSQSHSVSISKASSPTQIALPVTQESLTAIAPSTNDFSYSIIAKSPQKKQEEINAAQKSEHLALEHQLKALELSQNMANNSPSTANTPTTDVTTVQTVSFGGLDSDADSDGDSDGTNENVDKSISIKFVQQPLKIADQYEENHHTISSHQLLSSQAAQSAILHAESTVDNNDDIADDMFAIGDDEDEQA